MKPISFFNLSKMKQKKILKKVNEQSSKDMFKMMKKACNALDNWVDATPEQRVAKYTKHRQKRGLVLGEKDRLLEAVKKIEVEFFSIDPLYPTTTKEGFISNKEVIKLINEIL